MFGWGYTTAFYLISLYLLVIIVTQKYKKYCKRRKKIAKKWSAAAWSKSKGTWLRVPLAKKQVYNLELSVETENRRSVSEEDIFAVGTDRDGHNVDTRSLFDGGEII